MKPATTVEKVCRVLSVLRAKPALGVTEVAEEATLLPSDAHRILNSLRAFGYVDQNINTKKYHLGLELLKLGHSVYRHLDLGEVAKPRMRRLSEMATAVSNLAILDARVGDVIFVEQIDSPSDFQVRLRIGSHATPYATAVGKILAAHQDPSTVRRILGKCKIRKNTKWTITDTDKLCMEFEKIRLLGYATDCEESIEGAYCISAPVYSYNREVIAALSISTLAARVGSSQERSLIKMVRSTATMISADLGYKAIPATLSDVSKTSATY
jgi:IclR family transcriptional regulator, KDG regulon repressor